MTWMETIMKEHAEQYRKIMLDAMMGAMNKVTKEESIMKVTCNGFTGELVRMELNQGGQNYSLTLYDREKGVTYSFECVYPKNFQFLDGVVSFGE